MTSSLQAHVKVEVVPSGCGRSTSSCKTFYTEICGTRSSAETARVVANRELVNHCNMISLFHACCTFQSFSRLNYAVWKVSVLYNSRWILTNMVLCGQCLLLILLFVHALCYAFTAVLSIVNQKHMTVFLVYAISNQFMQSVLRSPL